MNQIAPTILRFDRFALDLTRGCLRGPDHDIDLRPKAFEVLRHLAVNAGRLVPKQELYEAVWPNVFVSDDSLVQCIRELRDKLGDTEHRLIKSVSRRGYLLDAVIAAPALPLPAAGSASRISGAWQTIAVLKDPARVRQVWGAAAGLFVLLLCAAAASMYLLARSPAPVASPASGGLVAGTPQSAPAHPAFKDCDLCPDMIALPAGEFMMGSPEDQQARVQVEGLPRRVAIAKPIAIGRFEVTVEQFAAFIAETGTPVSNQCRVISGFDGDSVNWSLTQASFRQQPGYDITGLHPAGCINWHEAQAYVAWLKRRTGKPYRLPTEAEWEYAARAGTTTNFSFGDDGTELCAYARFADLASSFTWRASCRSDITARGPTQVGTLKPNPWGLFDMHGNVWEWVEDCWSPNPLEIPTDGSALTRPGHCEVGVMRGGG
jgi:formylglycine-generating enzyme required for sulfatase activity/DNA-binding winged helix-turn-helix (wHTH) protein